MIAKECFITARTACAKNQGKHESGWYRKVSHSFILFAYRQPMNRSLRPEYRMTVMQDSGCWRVTTGCSIFTLPPGNAVSESGITLSLRALVSTQLNRNTIHPPSGGSERSLRVSGEGSIRSSSVQAVANTPSPKARTSPSTLSREGKVGCVDTNTFRESELPESATALLSGSAKSHAIKFLAGLRGVKLACHVALSNGS